MANKPIRIIEQSSLARLGAAKLNSGSVALVLGNTIHLWGVSKEGFLRNRRWVLHEIAHIRQYRKYGVPGFLARYLWSWIKKGYFKNRLEVEARTAEESHDYDGEYFALLEQHDLNDTA